MTIDLAEATKTQRTINNFDDYGEMVRVFTFDPKKSLFYLLRANFTQPGFNGTEPITLTTINPITAADPTTVLVKGAAGLVTGFHFNSKLNVIQFATYNWVDNKKVGYNFYNLDTTTGIAKTVSTVAFGAKDNWEGWFHEISDSGKHLYRLGYKDVINSLDWGLGITDISVSPAKSIWIDNITLPSGLSYLSINAFGDDFISMAEDYTGALSVVRWNYKKGNHLVLAGLSDGYDTRFFGPITEQIDYQNSKYYALVVHDGIIPVQTDRWALAMVDLKSPANYWTSPISPWMVAGVDSVAGFGIPQQ